MDMDPGRFDEPEHILVKLERFVGMQPALQQDLGAAEGLGVFYFFCQLGLGKHLAALVFRGLEKRAEFAGRDTDIGIIDVSVNDIGDHRLGMQPPPHRIRKKSQLMQTRLPLQPEKRLPIDPFTFDYFGDNPLHDR